MLDTTVYQGIFWNVRQRRYQVGLNGLAIFRYIQDALAFASLED